MLQPFSASLILSQDPRISRLRNHDGRNADADAPLFKSFSTGSRELDSHILLNSGFGPGSVVGISSEEEDTIGLGVGLQVIARMLLLSSFESSKDEQKAKAKAMIITTLSTTILLPRLRLALVSESRALQTNAGGEDGRGSGNGQQHVESRAKIKSCLERVLVARVFDVEGLREVLRELDAGSSINRAGPEEQENEGGTGIGGGRSSKKDDNDNLLPSLILITNTSHLLNTLFSLSKTGTDRSKAHNSAVELSDQIRGISKRGPLVMMLNSTTSPSLGNSGSMFDDNRGKGQKQPDLSTMRSIFNPPPPAAPMEGMADLARYGHSVGTPSAASHKDGAYGQQYQNQTQAAATAAAASKRNKPSYGMIFSQMLDLHLLCTKQSRGRSRHGEHGGYGGYVWAVEVLLDELGVYEGLEAVFGKGGDEEKWQGGQQEEGSGKGNGKGNGKGGLTRRSREQRWGAVEIEEGSGRVVDAFR